VIEKEKNMEESNTLFLEDSTWPKESSCKNNEGLDFFGLSVRPSLKYQADF